MSNPFFERLILNSPYEYPSRHWELDITGQPTGREVQSRRKAEFITPIPKPRKQKGKAKQQKLGLDDGSGLSTAQQQYEATATVINELRAIVDKWRELKDARQWGVTPERSAFCSTGVPTPSAITGRSTVRSKQQRSRSG